MQLQAVIQKKFIVSSGIYEKIVSNIYFSKYFFSAVLPVSSNLHCKPSDEHSLKQKA